MLWIYSLSCVGHDTENSWTMSMELMVDNENEHPANGQHHCGLSPQLSLSHAGHLHLLLCKVTNLKDTAGMDRKYMILYIKLHVK